MLYDAFTPLVLVQLEDYGFCKTRARPAAWWAAGNADRAAAMPVNTHGGHLSEGYVHGLNHIAEAVQQLRGDAGERQVAGAEVALSTGQPGYVAGTMSALRPAEGRMSDERPVLSRLRRPRFRAVVGGRRPATSYVQQQCSDCGTWRWPPRALCGRCGSLEWSWQPVLRPGTVVSWITTHHAFLPGFEAAVSHRFRAAGSGRGVDEQDDIVMPGELVRCRASDFTGMPVVVHFDDHRWCPRTTRSPWWVGNLCEE